MPHTSLFSGFRLACQARVETNTPRLEELPFLAGVKVFKKALQKLPIGQLTCYWLTTE